VDVPLSDPSKHLFGERRKFVTKELRQWLEKLGARTVNIESGIFWENG
jgi:hypothetical protein